MNKIGISALIVLCAVVITSSASYSQGILEPLYYDGPNKMLSQSLDTTDLQGIINGGIVIDEIGEYDPTLNDSLQQLIARLHEQADSLNKEAKKLAELYKKKIKRNPLQSLDSIASDGSFFFRMDPFSLPDNELPAIPYKNWDNKNWNFQFTPPSLPELKGRTPYVIPPQETKPFPGFPHWKVKPPRSICDKA